MQLAPVATATAPFTTVTALPTKTGAAPTVRPLGWDEVPAEQGSLVSIRYRGTDHDGSVHQRTVRNDHEFTSPQWFEVRGGFDAAVRAARDLAIVEGYDDTPSTGNFARTSVAVLDAGKGAFHLVPLAFSEGFGDGMDAIISIPIDAVVGESTSQVSLPYGYMSGADFDRPDRGVSVRFDDPRVAAVVGVDSIAVAPR